MTSIGRPWQELAQGRPFANAPVAGGFTIQEVKSWREGELAAGRPSGLEDFYRAHDLCFACRSKGIRLSPIDWDGDVPLYEECEACGGTGKLVQPPT